MSESDRELLVQALSRAIAHIQADSLRFAHVLVNGVREALVAEVAAASQYAEVAGCVAMDAGTEPAAEGGR